MIKGYTSPTAAQLRRFFRVYDIKQSAAAEMLGFSSSRQVRKYTGGEKPRRISFPLWWTLNAHVVLSQSVIQKLHKKAFNAYQQDNVTMYFVWFSIAGYWYLDADQVYLVNQACINSLNL